MSILHQLYNKGEARGISIGKAEGINLSDMRFEYEMIPEVQRVSAMLTLNR